MRQDAAGLGRGSTPGSPARQTAEPSPGHSMPCLAGCKGVEVFSHFHSFLQERIARQTATDTSLQWSATCFLVGYAGLKA